MKLIAKSKGIQIGKFYIPPFELHAGELMGIYLSNSPYFHEIVAILVNLLTGKKQHPNLILNHSLQFVERPQLNTIKERFFPMTVGKYLRLNGQSGSKQLEKIYEVDYITPTTKLNELAGNPIKWLSLFTTLSKTNNIIFDHLGQDPLGVEQTMEYVMQVVENSGSAVMLENFTDMEERCTRFYRVEIRGH